MSKELKECTRLLAKLSRSAKVVSNRINSGDYIPEFRYKNMETDIANANLFLKVDEIKEATGSLTCQADKKVK